MRRPFDVVPRELAVPAQRFERGDLRRCSEARVSATFKMNAATLRKWRQMN
jgi:hypothetical protein